jgi:hypothetical protein
MASPFRNNKRARKRYRKRTKSELEWAEKHAVAGTKPASSVDVMRWLAEFNLRMAQSKRKKSSRPKAAG